MMTTNTPASAATSTDAHDWPNILAAALESGEMLDLAEGVEDAALKERITNYPETLPLLPAEVLRASLLDQQSKQDPNGLQLRGVRIGGDLDLDFVELSQPLRLHSVVIEGDLLMTSFVGTDVVLSEVVLCNLFLTNAQVQNDFTAYDCKFSGAIAAARATFGAFTLDGSLVEAPVEDKALDLNLASVRGDVSIEDVKLHARFNAIGADVRGSLLLRGLDVSIRVASATSGEAVDPVLTAICLDSAKIGGILDGTGVTCSGALLARGARVGGQLKLTGAQLERPSGLRLLIDLDGIDVSHDAMLDRVVAGSLSMIGSTVRELSLRGVQLGASDGVTSFWGDGVKVQHHVYLDGAEIEGTVHLRGAVIGGNVTSVAFPGTGVQSAEVSAIDISDSLIGNSFRVESPLQGLMLANRAVITGVLDLGLIGLMSTAGITARGSTSDGLVAHGASIGHLIVGPYAQQSTLDLSNASIEILEIKEPNSTGTVVLPHIRSTKAWRIGSVRGLADYKRARGWLSAGGDKLGHAQPWFALADVFERSGRESDARRLRFDATDGVFKQRSNWFANTIWRSVTKWTIGHGYYSQGALAWLAALYVVAVVLVGANAPDFTPTDRSAALPVSMGQQAGAESDAAPPAEVIVTTAASSPVPDAYPGFVPALYAVDVVLSPLGTGQAEAWWVSTNPWLIGGIVALKLLSWALLGLFVSGVSGLISRR